MAMLQYRHKTRAWRQMVTTDNAGSALAIKDMIGQGITEGDDGAYDREADFDTFMQRLVQTRGRLESRLVGLPDDSTLRSHLQGLPASLIHALVVSQPWDTSNVGGEEVDVDWLLEAPRRARTQRPAAPSAAGAV
jgi:hypothetical protein